MQEFQCWNYKKKQLKYTFDATEEVICMIINAMLFISVLNYR